MSGVERARKVLAAIVVEHGWANEPGADALVTEMIDRMEDAGVIILSESGRRD
jgi:hypothetical protein